MMKHFALGYAFFDNRVVLIRKTHPEWQAGLYNGVGGHVEDGETLALAMTTYAQLIVENNNYPREIIGPLSMTIQLAKQSFEESKDPIAPVPIYL